MNKERDDIFVGIVIAAWNKLFFKNGKPKKLYFEKRKTNKRAKHESP